MKKVFLLLLTIAIASFITAQVNLTKGLIAKYDFNNNYINSAGSHSNGNQNGGVSFLNSKSSLDSQCIALDGINDNISVAIDSFVLTNYTYSLWTKPTVIPSTGSCKVIFDVGGLGGDQVIQLCNTLNSSAPPFLLHGFFGGGYITGTSQTRAVTGITPDTSKWYHLALVRFDKGMKFYVNCTLIDSIYDNSSANYGTQVGVTIGSRFNNNSFYNGKVDNLRVYNRALNLTEIKTLGECLPSSIRRASEASIQVDLIPNPGVNNVVIQTQENKNVEVVNVYNSLGVLITNHMTKGSQIDINTESLSAGTYIFRVNVGDSWVTKRFTKL